MHVDEQILWKLVEFKTPYTEEIWFKLSLYRCTKTSVSREEESRVSVALLESLLFAAAAHHKLGSNVSAMPFKSGLFRFLSNYFMFLKSLQLPMSSPFIFLWLIHHFPLVLF